MTLITKIQEFYERYSNKEYCLMEVKRDGLNLQYVKCQDYEICEEAFKQNPASIFYVLDRNTFYSLEKKLREL